MTSLREIIQSLTESSRDRMNNPVIGAFIFSWTAINWRIIAILLFSDKNIEDKIEHIECYYFNYTLNLWVPLGFAIFYILLLPYIMASFDWLLQRAVSFRRLIFKNQRIQDIQSRQEIAAEEWQLDKIKQGSPDIEQLKNKITELEQSIQKKDNLISTLSTKIDETNQYVGLTEEVKEEKKADSFERTYKTKPRKKTPIKSNTTVVSSSVTERKEPTDYPTMKEIVIRDLPKTEREWILIYALYVSEFGSKSLTREDLMRLYEESNRKTDSRLANLSNNIKNMIKAGQFKFLNDNEMLLTSSGIEMAKEILNR